MCAPQYHEETLYDLMMLVVISRMSSQEAVGDLLRKEGMVQQQKEQYMQRHGGMEEWNVLKLLDRVG